MEKIFISAMLLFSLVVSISSCKKKKDDPTPTPTPTISVNFSWNGTSVPFNTPTTTLVSGYHQTAHSATTSQSLTVNYPNGKPSSSTSYNVDTQGALANISYVDASGNTWNSIGGTLTVTVNQGYVTSSFTNATFINMTDGTTQNAIDSGSITTN